MYIRNDRSDLIIEIIKGNKPSHKIVDLGCNDGATLIGLKSSGLLDASVEYHGVDYADISDVEQGEISFHISDLNGDLLDIKSLLESSNLILLLDVLEHLFSPEEFMFRLSKILSKNTEIIISVPNAASVRLFMAWIKKDFPRDDIGYFDRTHRSWFTKNTLTNLLIGEYKILGVSYIYSKNEFFKIIQKINPSRLTSQFYFHLSLK